jgi:hypothetical protein
MGFVFTDGSIPDIETSESAQFLKIDPETIAAIKKDTAEYMENVGRILF